MVSPRLAVCQAFFLFVFMSSGNNSLYTIAGKGRQHNTAKNAKKLMDFGLPSFSENFDGIKNFMNEWVMGLIGHYISFIIS